MTAAVLVFVNEQIVRVPAGANLADAVAIREPELAAALRSGKAYLTDGRGIRLAADSPVFAGAILRVVVTARPGPSAPPPLRPSDEADAHA